MIMIIIFGPSTRGFVSLTLNHSGARYPKYNHDWIIIHFDEVDDGSFTVSGLSSPTSQLHTSLYMLNNKRGGKDT